MRKRYWLPLLVVILLSPSRAWARNVNYSELESIIRQYGLEKTLQAMDFVLIGKECPGTDVCSVITRALGFERAEHSPVGCPSDVDTPRGKGYLLKENVMARQELAMFFSSDTRLDISDMQRLFLVWHFSNNMTYSDNIFDVINQEMRLVVGWNSYHIFNGKIVDKAYTFGVIGCTVVLLASEDGYYMLSHNEAQGVPEAYNSEIAYWEIKQFLDNFSVKTIYIVGAHAGEFSKMIQERNKNIEVFTHEFKKDYSTVYHIFVDVHDGVRFYVEKNAVDREYLRQIQDKEIDFPFRPYPLADMTMILPSTPSGLEEITFFSQVPPSRSP